MRRPVNVRKKEQSQICVRCPPPFSNYVKERRVICFAENCIYFFQCNFICENVDNEMTTIIKITINQKINKTFSE